MTQLYIVATPIGNLEDITIRALDTLKSVNTILCEDTRITSRLLQKYEIKDKKLVIYNDLSGQGVRDRILEVIKSEDMALVSDAGTPLISDPGQKLIKFLKDNNIKISPIPGCSSPIAAISTSGLALDKFLFLGFLPSQEVKRKNQLKELKRSPSFVFFESPKRLIKSLHNIAEVLGNRQITVARELTKIHEQIITDKVSNVISYFGDNPDKVKGEIVIIVERSKNHDFDKNSVTREIESMLNSGLSTKDITTELSQIYDINKKEIYDLALQIKK